jgi:EAL domain-containing protein (putative c-di-GMP-specific phosphodiesterase class I)
VDAGFGVVLCDAVSVALDRLDRDRFDAIVTGVALPESSGIDLLRVVRTRDPDMPVVLISDAPLLENAEEALELGAFRYLRRPSDAQRLVQIVSRASHLCRIARAKEAAFKALGTSTGRSSGRLSLNAAFDRALETLWPAFQPVISASDGSVFGYEALMRSGEPSFPHPGALLDAAERLGKLDLLARTMRERACSRFLDSGMSGEKHLFLNLHPQDLSDPELLSPHSRMGECSPRVILEMTERATLDAVPNVKGRVAALRESGHRIAIDDLGAGYAGLTSFVELEPELVKLDMSLIRDLDKSTVKQGLVRAMTNLSKELGLLVIAEGIETEAERDAAIEFGVDLLQGFRFGPPVPRLEAPRW